MQAILQATLVVVLSAGTALAVQSLSAPEAAPPTVIEGVSPDELEALAAHVDALRQRLAQLPDQLAEPVTVRETVLPTEGETRAIVERAVEEMVRSGLVASGEAWEDEAPVEAVRWPGDTESAMDAFQAILAAGIDSEEARALWAEAAENGQLHELLEEMELAMEGEPETADKHFQLARGYYSAARVKPDNRDGNWWVDSDDAFDQALELDPQHWDARYQKAVNQSFWPTAYGGQAEAIRNFEILLDQQETREPEERFAKSYVWLGNLYDQQGRTEMARQTWERGLALHPGHTWLQSRLDSLK